MQIIGQWPLLVADFASEYGLRLHQVFHRMGFTEFTHLVTGLFATDSRLSRHFKPDPEGADQPPEE